MEKWYGAYFMSGHLGCRRAPCPTLSLTTIRTFATMSAQSNNTSSPIRFASFDVTNQVFYENDSAVAIVNLKPVVPGHVLVIPKTHYERFADIPPADLAKLFDVVQAVGKVVEHAFSGDSLSIAIQDGPNAGQTVAHVHVHVLPRRAGDIEPNDLVYEHLERFGLELRSIHEKQMDSERKPRSPEQMHAEAEWLRTQCAQVLQSGP